LKKSSSSKDNNNLEQVATNKNKVDFTSTDDPMRVGGISFADSSVAEDIGVLDEDDDDNKDEDEDSKRPNEEFKDGAVESCDNTTAFQFADK
jgi:hypothetical protein